MKFKTMFQNGNIGKKRVNDICRKLYRLRIVITKNIEKRLATNHLSTNK